MTSIYGSGYVADMSDKLKDPIGPADFGISAEYAEQAQHYANFETSRLRTERDSYGKQLAECQNGYETLEKEVANLKAIDVHSCHANCTRSGCVAANLREAIKHYEAALKLSWPEGAKGEVWEHWNEARRVLG
jgi:hypothetical protein